MNWNTWWLFVVTEAILCLTPGPAVLLVLSQALSRGAAVSVFSTLGILAANTFYFALSATSLGAILVASYDLFFAIKWIGAGYLLYLGLGAIFGKSSILEASTALSPPRLGRIFAHGFVLQASNPKAILFFAALLPQFIDPQQAVGWQVFVLGASSVTVEFFILLGYGVLAGKASAVARQPRYAAWTNRIAGGLLIAAGAGLALLRRG